MNKPIPLKTEPTETRLDLEPRDSESPELRARENRNFLATTIYQISLRIGWIFKTESVIIPAALDSIGGTGWIRGCLPMLNRLGQSIPPILVWPAIKSAKQQKRWLACSTLIMGLVFCAIAGIWLGGFHNSGAASKWVFLILYALFFVATGINQLTLSSLIGKLIRVNRRGRLMLFANTLGCLCSIACAWFILRAWLGESEANFAAIFAMSGGCFIVAATTSFWIDEPRVAAGPREPWHLRSLLNAVWQTWVQDREFRKLAVISALFGLSMTLFPHYQNLARVRLDLGFSDLLPWLILQNLGVASFSIPAGAMADRWGNRVVLRIVLLLLVLAPMMALISSSVPSIGQTGILVVFFLLGLTPVTMRILANYALEFTTTEHQPRYLAAQSLAMAVPVIASSALVGKMIDLFGFDRVFGVVIGGMLLAWLLTFRLHEPRK